MRNSEWFRFSSQFYWTKKRGYVDKAYKVSLKEARNILRSLIFNSNTKPFSFILFVSVCRQFPLSGEGHTQNSRAEFPKPLIYRTLPVALLLCCCRILTFGCGCQIPFSKWEPKNSSERVIILIFYTTLISTIDVRILYTQWTWGIHTTGIK